MMKIAVLSGKGGAGKTFVAVNLSVVAKDAVYVDCDVEEPNGHLFLKPKETHVETVTLPIPKFDNEKCIGCRKCADFCAFGALAFIKGKPVLFPEICHSCGGCALICPANAVTEEEKTVGWIREGSNGALKAYFGEMAVGEASGVAIIKGLLGKIQSEKKDVIIDCPPGSACVVMESIKDADFCLLVAEPTIFGRHNLEMVYELVKLFEKPFAVVLNKCSDEWNPSADFCSENQVPVVGKIDFNHSLGEIIGNGEIAVEKEETYRKVFAEILSAVRNEVVV